MSNTTIKAHIVEAQQGTEAWHQHRSKALNASELAAAMGLSAYISRADLIKQKASGIVPDVDAATQRRFDAGHQAEAMTRPFAEEIIGEELYASVFAAEVDGLLLSASLDGHTLLNELTWENKWLNAELAASLDAGVIPDQYHPQMEQGLMLTGASKCLFSASNGDKESMRSVWYESNPELRAKIIPTWKQFMADVAAYVPTEAEAPKPIGRTPDQLPSLRSSVKGELVLESNIKEWEAAALEYIQSVRNHELVTDEDFENADAAAAWCASSKTTLDGLKSSLMSATGDVNTAVGTIDRIISELDKTRIQFTNASKVRKDARKSEIVAAGSAAFAKYVRELNATLPADYMPKITENFGGCIKNLRTFKSIQNAVDSELSRVKVEADVMADRIRANMAQLDAANAPMLFADIKSLVLKSPEDLAAVIAQRVAAEDKRKADEREKIRAEEAARIERENAAKEAAEKAEAERLERQRENAAKVEADRIAREQAEAVSAARIRDEQIAQQMRHLDHAEDAAILAPSIEERPSKFSDYKVNVNFDTDFILSPETPPPEDNGTRLTLTQINDRLAPVSISVSGLSSLGFDPVEQVKASRLYRECDLPAICQAISAHVLAASVMEVA